MSGRSWLSLLRFFLNQHRTLNTSLRTLNCGDLGNPIENGLERDCNLLSIPGHIEWLKDRGNLIDESYEPGLHDISILDVYGLWAANTHGDNFDNLCDFAMSLRNDFPGPARIGFQTEEDFQANVDYIGKWIYYLAGSQSHFTAYHHEWDGRYYIGNSDGAHHLAAIYRQCKEQSRVFTLKCRIKRCRPNRNACRRLLDHNYMLLFQRTCAERIAEYTRLMGILNVNCVPYSDNRALIMLSKYLPESRIVYESVKAVMPPSVYFDYSNYLHNLIASG